MVRIGIYRWPSFDLNSTIDPEMRRGSAPRPKKRVCGRRAVTREGGGEEPGEGRDRGEGERRGEERLPEDESGVGPGCRP